MDSSSSAPKGRASLPPLSAAQQAIATRSYAIARNAARYFARGATSGRSESDLLSVAHEALVRGVMTYDAAKGPLEPYLWLRVRGAMKNALHQSAKDSARTRAAARAFDDYAFGVEDEADVFNDGDEALREQLASVCDGAAAAVAAGVATHAWHSRGEATIALEQEVARTMTHLQDEVAALPTQLATLVELRYFRQERIDAIAAATGLSPQKVVRQLNEALRLLRARLRGRGVSGVPA